MECLAKKESPNTQSNGDGVIFAFLEDGHCVIHYSDQGSDVHERYTITKLSRISLTMDDPAQEKPDIVSGTYRFVSGKLLLRLVARSQPSLLMIPRRGVLLMTFDRV